MSQLRFLLKPWFIACILTGIIIRYYLRPTGFVFIDCYLNDVLSTPILFQLSLVTLALLQKRAPRGLNGYQLLFGWVWISIHFEWLFPLLKSNVTSDWLDVLAYLIGTGIFYIIQKQMFSPVINHAN
jgi:hypothetical protein